MPERTEREYLEGLRPEDEEEWYRQQQPIEGQEILFDVDPGDEDDARPARPEWA